MGASDHTREACWAQDMASPFIQTHYGWTFITHFLNNMRKAGVINCLKKYKEIQEFKFGELVGVDKFGNRYLNNAHYINII
jgi:hypothetical protein